MQKSILSSLVLFTVCASAMIGVASAQVRGYSAIGPDGATRVDVNVRVETGGTQFRDTYYDNRSHRNYRTYSDRYHDDYYYAPRQPYRHGEVYYPRHRDNDGTELIAGLLVGAVIGYALADDNDHHHRRYRDRHYRDHHYYDNRKRKRRYHENRWHYY